MIGLWMLLGLVGTAGYLWFGVQVVTTPEWWGRAACEVLMSLAAAAMRSKQ